MRSTYTNEERERRYDEILARRIAGETLEAIGKDYDVTRERIRQIVCRQLEKKYIPTK